MNKEVRKVIEQSEAKARQTPFYKTLIKRTYRRISGYPDFKKVAVDLAMHLMCLKEGFEVKGFNDSAWNAMTHSAYMAYENPVFPVFAITRELAQAFLATDLPSHVCGLNRSFENALFLFPELIRTPDDYICQWAFTTHFLKGDCIENLPKAVLRNFTPENLKRIDRIKMQPFEISKLRWVSQVGKNPIIYSSVINLPEDAEEPVTGDIGFGESLESWGHNTNPEPEQEFTRTVDKLLLQSLLYLQSKPEAVSATPPTSHGSGSGFKGNKSHQTLEPIWLGKNYEPLTTGKPHGTHASPRLHWRRGHWRRVAIGEKRSERRWQWFEPVLVNAE